MTTHSWTHTRDDAIEAFNGETPGAQLEQDILVHFTDDPEKVLRAITRIAQQTGITSRWAVLRADLNRAHQSDVVASSTKGTQRAIDNTKTWIRNAGIHYDLERDIEAELFGDTITRGRLTDHHLTPTLKNDLIAYWREQRPRGVKAEADAEAWMAKCKADRQRILDLNAQQAATLRAELDAKQRTAAAKQADAQPAAVTAGADDDFPF